MPQQKSGRVSDNPTRSLISSPTPQTTMNDLLTHFPVAPESIPAVMPNPFADSPHPLAVEAAHLLQQRLSGDIAWPGDYSPERQGKMFGVLMVRDSEGHTGFLSAFSGMMGRQWHLPGFVPPIFDQSEMDELVKQESIELAAMNDQLTAMQQNPEKTELAAALNSIKQKRDSALIELKQQHKAARAERKQQRLAAQSWSDAHAQQTLMAELALASQRHKREATQATLHWQEKIEHLQQQLDRINAQITRLNTVRTRRSQALHRQMFAIYRLSNHLHEQKPITEFFPETLPPAGTGDCAGPKLLHYALLHQLQPLAMAEFWWGASPAAGVRHHGQFYPACRGKCLPILPFMLRGLEVEAPPSYEQDISADEPRLIYEDDQLLVVNKPAGLMSTPGKQIRDSVQWRLQQRYPDCPELRLVHRLDMDTSGLLLVAKTLRANKALQRQFVRHDVEKCYEAILSKRLPASPNEGIIDLPLRIDFDDRPRQLVCYEFGKPAITRWEIIAREGETTRVRFYPQTGRTHQLRMHASHRDGLNAAIVGDVLYGQPAERMMLHARELTFTHPITRERLKFEAPAPF